MLKFALALTLALYANAQTPNTQSPNGPRGHWTGSLELPNRATMPIAFDLDKSDKGWIGSMSVIQQGVTIPLADIRSEEGQWKFKIPAGPGAPAFAGKLAEDGKTLDGALTQNGQSMALKLSHAGEPKVELPKVSTALPKEFTGDWEGTLEGPGLRLILKISNDAGAAKATLVSLDQNNAGIPVTTLSVKEGKLFVEVKMVGGSYQGQINQDSTALTGEWTQNGNTLPLTFTKKAKPTP